MRRAADRGDGRYATAVPLHVRTVRELALDPLSASDQLAVVRIAPKAEARLSG